MIHWGGVKFVFVVQKWQSKKIFFYWKTAKGNPGFTKSKEKNPHLRCRYRKKVTMSGQRRGVNRKFFLTKLRAGHFVIEDSVDRVGKSLSVVCLDFSKLFDTYNVLIDN